MDNIMSLYYRIKKSEYNRLLKEIDELCASVPELRSKYDCLKEENKFLKEQINNLTKAKILENSENNFKSRLKKRLYNKIS